MERSSSPQNILKLGNLILAGFLSFVPTAITIFIFYLYGLNLCSSLEGKYQDKLSDYESHITICESTVKELNYKYLLLIWLIITLPTWRWFYINHLKRSKG